MRRWKYSMNIRVSCKVKDGMLDGSWRVEGKMVIISCIEVGLPSYFLHVVDK